MDTDKKRMLIEKRERLQQLLTLKKYSKQHIEPWLSIYSQLIENKVKPEVHYLASSFDLNADILRQAIDALLQPDQKTLLNKILIEENLIIHEKMEEHYPSSNPLRYMPESDKVMSDKNAENMIRQAIRELAIPEQTCFVLYPVYSPVMELALSDILAYCDIIIEPMTDVSIIAKDYSWIIFHSLEEEWIWKKQQTAKSRE